MEIEWDQGPKPELTPSEYDSIDDWASETSSVDDILSRDQNFERNSDILNRALNTYMTPVIDPNNVNDVQIVRWTYPPRDFHIIDPPEIGPAYKDPQPRVKLVRIN